MIISYIHTAYIYIWNDITEIHPSMWKTWLLVYIVGPFSYAWFICHECKFVYSISIYIYLYIYMCVCVWVYIYIYICVFDNKFVYSIHGNKMVATNNLGFERALNLNIRNNGWSSSALVGSESADRDCCCETDYYSIKLIEERKNQSSYSHFIL